MQYIFFTYNLLTLCRAIRYTDLMYGKDNTTIIYSDFVSELPTKLQQDYSIEYVDSHSLNNGINGLQLVMQTSNITNQIWKVIQRHISTNSNDKVVLIVFRDNEIQETTWISRLAKKMGGKAQIWLMEEGAGLYAAKRAPIRYSSIKRLIYTIKEVSRESLQNYTQGMNPKINKVICTNPDEFRKKRNDLSVDVEKMIDVFVPEFNNYLIDSIDVGNITKSKYDFVFLTQPFHDFKNRYDELLKTHDELLLQIFDILSKKGKTVIKLHPREQYDYAKFQGQGVDLPGGVEQQLPFECLMQLYGNPQMISMFSSTCINVKIDKPSIYLGELFNFPVAKELFDVEFYKKNNIFSCKTLEEFKNIINCEKSGGKENV